MAEIATNFPPQTYSSSFFLNSLADEKSAVSNSNEGSVGKRPDNNTPFLDCFISTMFFTNLFLTVILLHTSMGLNCTIPKESRTRIFDSLVDYQGNKLPFKFSNPGWSGSNVEFNFSKITNLPRNGFITYDSQNIIKIKLSGKQIESIDEGAFTSLDCLNELLLNHNCINVLSKDTFQGLTNLERLDLSNNLLTELPDLVFENLSVLKFLNLAHNKIKKLEILAFTNLRVLEYLNLEFNQLKKIPNDVFQPLVALKTLNLASNRLVDIEPEKWSGLTNLEILNLAQNGLNHFDPTYNFSFLTLKTLNLSGNFLTELNVLGITRHLSHLGFIDINNNPWFCSDLTRIQHELADSKIKLIGRNSSGANINGIACTDDPSFKYTTEATTTFTTNHNNNSVEISTNSSHIDEIIDNKIMNNNEKIMTSLNFLQNLVIFVFILLIVFIVYEMFVRTECCRFLINRIQGGNEMYFDSTNVENFHLLHR